MSYSLATLWYERQRYLPGVLAVAFSALLIALQCGLLLGLFSITSIPIDHNRPTSGWAHPQVLERRSGPADPREHLGPPGRPAGGGALRSLTCKGFAYWAKPDRRHRTVHGHRLAPRDPIRSGKIDKLTPEQCGLLGRSRAPSSSMNPTGPARHHGGRRSGGNLRAASARRRH